MSKLPSCNDTFADLVNSLNPKQSEAVLSEQSALMVLAGAGSGKTKVLTMRIAWLIYQQHILPRQILAVTFTNKAAKEMLLRISNILGDQLGYNLYIGTFHSLALKILRSNILEAGLKVNFNVVDNNEQLSMLKMVIKEKLQLTTEQYNPRDLQQWINHNKENCIRSTSVDTSRIKDINYIKIYRAYEELCIQNNVVDFTELLLRSFELLNYNPSILAKYHQQFRHILIDEFQDTNALQYKWLKLLRSKNCSIFAVGDDDQSIYSFRGAQVDNMQKFIQDFGATNPIRLEQNYRSNNNILAIANALIAHNTTRIGKTLWTDNTNEIPIYWQELFNENAESRFVIEQIKQLNKQGVDYSQIAVLYRSNAQSRVIEQELYKEKIPYRVYGGLRFFDREEIKHILAYLRLIINRDDDNALLRIINVPPRKIGNKTLEVLQQMAQIKQLSLFESIKQLAGSVRTKLDKFAELIEDLHIQIDKLELSQLLVYIIEQTGLKDHYLALGNEGVNRLENLSQLVSAVAEFAKVSSTEFILDFLTNSVLDNDILHDSGEENVVRLMTVHASKGLEFKAVFIVGLEDGLFPHQNALQLKSGEEEERRLMYVAVTRAREHLYLTRACSRLMWGTQYTSPVSRFISEIPASHLVSLPIARQDYI